MLLGTKKCIYATILRTLLELMQLMQYAVDFNGKNEHKCSLCDKSSCLDWTFRFTYWDFADFLSNNSRNTLNGLSQSPPSQTFCDIHNHKRHRLLSKERLLSSSQLRHSGVSGTLSLSSAWRCTRTFPFPSWPSSWQWDQCLCSVAASAAHLRLASVERM